MDAAAGARVGDNHSAAGGVGSIGGQAVVGGAVMRVGDGAEG